ncbi:MAG: hypothetical protein ABW049_03775 [Spongiibacteraceae bacterium]
MRRGRKSRDQQIIGITLDVAHGESIPTPPSVLGDIEIRNLRVTFSDMFIFEQWEMTREPALLIGMDLRKTSE